MGIPDEDVAQVKAATDLVALIGEHTALRQSGRRWSGLCPFHAEKTPSFSVNAQEGFYYCFGCQASGDAVTFVRAMEHLEFAEAVRFLADKAGVTIHEDERAGPDHKRRAELFEAMERAVEWYHQRMLSAKDAGAARDYLRSRGYDGEVVRRFRLGWAPDEWDALSVALALPERVLTGTGLGFVNRRGRLQDSFRARVIFPIMDHSGKPMALGGRILPARPGAATAAPSGGRGPEPKYKNSTETSIYSKRRTLYALNWAKHDVIASGEVVVCEGYTDVIGCFTSGMPRAVATCGTALTEEHFKLLRGFAKRVVLAYDADSAGQSAIQRIYEWERRHEVDVVVAALPPGSDPGDLARSDPAALAQAVAQARPFLQFKVDRVFELADTSTAEGRAKAADRAIEAVAEHPDDLVRDPYVMQVADRCRLDADRLRTRLGEVLQANAANDRAAARRETDARARPGRPGAVPGGPGPAGGAESGEPPPREPDGYDPDDGGGPGSPGAGRGPGPAPGANRPGLEALRLAVHRPEAVAARLEAVLFADELHQRAFAALASAQSLHQAIDDAPTEVADLLRRLAVDEPPEATSVVGDPVDAVVAHLTREAVKRELKVIEAEARVSPTGLVDLAGESAEVRRRLFDLDDLANSRDAADQLLAWLLGRREAIGDDTGIPAGERRGDGATAGA